MNPERLLKLFDRVAEAPDAVARLRRLVLDLAVRGKLVEQNSREEPAALLLATIHAESAQPIKKKITEYSFAVPYILPKSWHWSKIEEISHNWGQKIPDKHFTYIDVSAIDSKRGVISSPSVVEPKKAPSRARKIVQVGSVIYSTVRPYLLNVAVIEKEYSPEPIASTAFSILHPFEGVYNRYLWYWLRSPAFIEIVSEKMRGQAYPAINERNFAALPIPIPPTLEQYRIVQRVDELMALCDQLEAAQTNREQRRDRLSAAALDRLVNAEPSEEGHTAARFYLNRLPRLVRKVEHVQALRRTILNVAVRGRLVEQTLEDTSVYSLLEQAKAIKNSMASHKPEFLILNDENEQLYPIPENWVWCFMEELFLITGGIQKSPKREPIENHFPYLRVANVQRGKLDLFKIERFELFGDELERLKLKEGDLLIVEGNGSEKEIGRCARWNNEIENCVHQNHLIRCRPLIASTEMYVLRFLNAPAGIEIMKNLAVTTTGLFNLSVGKIKSIPVPLPPQEEQGRIIAKVDQLMSLCNQLEISLQASQQTTSRLLDALIAEALSDSPDPETVEAETQFALSD